jgi:hypothetical protein
MRMKKIILGVLGGVILVVLVIAVAGFYRFNFTDGGDIIPGQNAPDVRSMIYTIGTEELALSSSTLSIFGEPVYGDLNADGKANDAALWLAYTPGGSGTFYYGVLVINNNGSYQVTNTMLLGDRIAPQTLEIQAGRAVYNFAERKALEPMTTPPSVGRSVWVHYDIKNNEIGEWVKDFEGESAI